MTIRMRVDRVTLRRDRPEFAVVELSRVMRWERETPMESTMNLEVGTDELGSFLPGACIDVTITPTAKVQA